MSHYVLSGISYPFRKEGAGIPVQAKGIDAINAAYVAFIKTRKRSRVMRPTLGLGLESLLFDDTGEILRSMIVREIATGTANVFPMIELMYIDVQNDNKKVTVNIFYKVMGLEQQTGALEFETEGNAA